MSLKPVEVYAILRRRLGDNTPSSIIDETLTVNENGEIEIVITLGNIYVDMTDGYSYIDQHYLVTGCLWLIQEHIIDHHV